MYCSMIRKVHQGGNSRQEVFGRQGRSRGAFTLSITNNHFGKKKGGMTKSGEEKSTAEGKKDWFTNYAGSSKRLLFKGRLPVCPTIRKEGVSETS